VDAAISGSGTGGWLAACAVLVALFVISEAVTELATGVAGATATAWLRELLGRHVLAVGPRLPGSDGDTVSRVIGGAAEAGTGPVSVVTAIAAAIPPVGAVIALGLIDPWVAVAFALGFPVLALMLRGLARDSSRIGADYGTAQGAIATRLLDALAGARTIAAAGTQAAERRRILAPLPKLRGHGYEFWRVQARAAAQAAVLAPLLQAIVVAIAGLELARHHLTPGGLAAASQYAVLAVGIGASTTMITRLGRARGGARRVAGPLAVPPPRYGADELAAGSAGASSGIAGELRLRGVTVRSGDGGTVLRELNLTVPGGAAVAVVGRSGAGKSTLAELAGRLADPDDGSVTLDGTDLRRLAPDGLRRAVVYAFERPHLFGDTPREVIGFGGFVAAYGDIVTAARDSQAAVFIDRLPRGYDTLLADAPLSGGEIQRLGLARAFAHANAARLLILDDATSSLDTVTEMLVSQALTGRLRGRTRLIVAHRAATAARADLVAWIEDGRIRALAPHGHLWQDPDYRTLFAYVGPGEAHPCLSATCVPAARMSRGWPSGRWCRRCPCSPPAGPSPRRPPGSSPGTSPSA
jgi:ATP-binding cassette subfamily B protein